MKIRKGFVSNSSSASFIITIVDRDLDTIYLYLQDYMLNDLDDFRQRVHWRIENGNDDRWVHVAEMLFQYDSMTWDERIHNDLIKKLIPYYLEINWIHVGHDSVSFTSNTTIYNGPEDVNPIIKELVFLAIHCGMTFNYEVIDDQ